MNQDSLGVVRRRGGGGEVLPRLSGPRGRSLSLRSFGKHDADAGRGGRSHCTATAVHGLFVRGQRDLNALHHEGGGLTTDARLTPADRQTDRQEIVLHHPKLKSNPKFDYWFIKS